MRHKTFLISAILFIALLIVVGALFLSNNDKHEINAEIPSGNAVSIPVLLYHGVVKTSNEDNISVDKFKEQMYALKNAGYHAITLEEFYKFKKGDVNLPENSFLLTFDDGRTDSYKPVDPILKDLDYHALIFVIGNKIENTDGGFYLDKNQLIGMLKSGRWDIGSHAYDGHSFIKIDKSNNSGHFYGDKKWLAASDRLETNEEFDSRIHNDLSMSVEAISRLGSTIPTFAYPFGDYGQESINFSGAETIVAKNIAKLYKLSFYQPWVNDTYSYNYAEDTTMVKRIEPNVSWSGEQLIAELTKGKEKSIPFSFHNFTSQDGWKTEYGKSEYIDGKLRIYANNNTGAAIGLDGTKSMRDYSVKVQGIWQNGSNFVIASRYIDSNNYIGLSITPDKISIKLKSDGKMVSIAETSNQYVKMGEQFNISFSAVGDKLFASLDDKIILSGNVENNERYLFGGISIRTQDNIEDVASIQINSIDIANAYRSI